MELSPLLLASALLLLLSFLFLALHFFKTDAPPEKPNSSIILKSYPIIGNLPHFVKHRLRLLDWATELVVASPTNTVTVSPLICTANPSNIEHMLKTNFDNYPKGERFTSLFRDFLGEGIFTIDGEQWKVQRKTASFEFNTKSIRVFVTDAVRDKALGSLIPLLKQASLDGHVVDLQDVLEHFAFDNVCSLVFGQDPRCLAGGNEKGARLYDAFEEAVQLCVERTHHALPFMWRLIKWLNVGSERRLKNSIAIVHEFAAKLVRSRRGETSAASNAHNDLLSRFVEDGNYSEELIRDILICFILAGRDTTPAALTWFFWVVSSRRDIVETILEEIKSIRSRHGNYSESFTLEELREMHYLHAAISEVMRLYPPVPLLARTCREDDLMPDGTLVRKGWSVLYNSYAMGRMESIWGDDCMEIKPERWLEKGVFQQKSQFQYPVFHAGPRICLGKDMAYIQMKGLATCILERFEMDVVEKRGEHQLLVTMRMKGGLPVRIRERSTRIE